jgi:RNA polymerase sigma-70 factor (ECF subfamily)
MASRVSLITNWHRRSPSEGDDADERGLVASAQAGDEQAFVALHARYAHRVYRYCLARTANAGDAEDLTQITFLRIVEALPRYQQRGPAFGAWIFTIARNAVIDFARAKRNHLDLNELVERGWSAKAPPVEHQRERIENDLLADALPFLTRDQREVITLRFFAGLTTRETAVEMGKREDAVRALQSRAIAAIRRQLAGDHRRPTRVPRPAVDS